MANTAATNTTSSARNGTITYTQAISGNKVYLYVTQNASSSGTITACTCSTVSVSCNPTTAETSGSNVSTTVTVTGGTNCATAWKAYNGSTYLTSGSSGSEFTTSATGTYTFRSTACSSVTSTFTVSSASTDTTCYYYNFKNCSDTMEIGLFNVQPISGSIYYDMLATSDGTSIDVEVCPTGAYIQGLKTATGATVYVYGYENSSWTKLDTITLTLENKTFTYGNCDNALVYKLQLSSNSTATTASTELTSSATSGYIGIYSTKDGSAHDVSYSESCDWLTVETSTTLSNTTHSYKVTSTKNTSSARSCDITFTQADSNNTFVYTVKQSAGSVKTYTNTINVTFPNDYGGYIDLTITVNGVTLDNSTLGGGTYITGSTIQNTCTNVNSSEVFGFMSLSFTTNSGDTVSINQVGYGYCPDCPCYMSAGCNIAYGGDWSTGLHNYTSTSDKSFTITITNDDGGDDDIEDHSCTCSVSSTSLQVSDGLTDTSGNMIWSDSIKAVSTSSTIYLIGDVTINDCSACTGNYVVTTPSGTRLLKLASESYYTTTAVEGTYTLTSNDDSSKTSTCSVSVRSSGSSSGDTEITATSRSVIVTVSFPNSYGGYVFAFDVELNGEDVTNDSDVVTVKGGASIDSVYGLRCENVNAAIVSISCHDGDTIKIIHGQVGVRTGTTSTAYIVASNVNCYGYDDDEHFYFITSGIIGDLIETTVDSTITSNSISIYACSKYNDEDGVITI